MRKLHLKHWLIIYLMLSLHGLLMAECNYYKNLKAEESPIGIRLSWSTAYERNSYLFILEKSNEKGEFQELASLSAAKNSNTIVNYRFLDVHPDLSKISYRVKQVDIDGTFSYGDVFTIHRKLETNIMLVHLDNFIINNTCLFTLDALKEGEVNLKLLDNSGKIVWQGSQFLKSGLNQVSIDLSSQLGGDYNIVATMGADEKRMDIRKIYDEVPNTSNVAGKNKPFKN
jgi:hypothetical protein